MKEDDAHEESFSTIVLSAINQSDMEKTHPTVTAIVRHALENPDLTLYKLKSSAYKFAFLFVPISLPFLWLMFFWHRGIRVYDHTIFLLFSLSFMCLWQSLIALFSMSRYTAWLIPLALFYIPAHIFLQVKETYGVTGWGATWRTGALLFAGFCVFLLYIAMILAISLH